MMYARGCIHLVSSTTQLLRAHLPEVIHLLQNGPANDLDPFKDLVECLQVVLGQAIPLHGRPSVMQDPHLLEIILGFLLDPHHLGQAALVCRQWKTVAVQDVLWEPIYCSIGMGATHHPRRQPFLGYRGEMMRYGQCIANKRMWTGSEWWYDVVMGIEVFTSTPHRRILFMSGEISVSEDNPFVLTMDPMRPLRGVPGPALSEPSESLSGADYSVRVWMTDDRNGKTAMIYHGEKQGAQMAVVNPLHMTVALDAYQCTRLGERDQICLSVHWDMELDLVEGTRWRATGASVACQGPHLDHDVLGSFFWWFLRST